MPYSPAPLRRQNLWPRPYRLEAAVRFLIKFIMIVAGGMLLCGQLTGCRFAGEPMPDIASTINKSFIQGSDFLAAGDTIELSFEQSDLSQTVQVPAGGNVTLRGLRRPINVLGLSLSALTNTVMQRHAAVGFKGKLTITLQSLGPRNIFIIGEVLTPGTIDIGSQRVTMVDAIARAGGFRKETAELNSILLVRWNQQSQTQLRYKINANLAYWGTGEPVHLQAYDVIYVPNTAVDDVAIAIDNWIRRQLPIPATVVPL